MCFQCSSPHQNSEHHQRLLTFMSSSELRSSDVVHVHVLIRTQVIRCCPRSCLHQNSSGHQMLSTFMSASDVVHIHVLIRCCPRSCPHQMLSTFMSSSELRSVTLTKELREMDRLASGLALLTSENTNSPSAARTLLTTSGCLLANMNKLQTQAKCLKKKGGGVFIHDRFHCFLYGRLTYLLKVRQPHRITSGLFTKSNITQVQYKLNGRHKHSLHITKTSWSSHINISKVKVTLKCPTVVASLMLIACTVAESWRC